MGRERPPAGREPSHEELATLASGWLEPERRRDVEAWVAASPRLAALLAEQRRAAGAVREIEVRASPGLRARIEAPRERRRPRPRGRRMLAALAAAAVAVAVAVAVALVVVGGGGGAAPSVADAAGLAIRPATRPAPPPDAKAPQLLALAAEGLDYPNWREGFGWSATGWRLDRLDGRRASTVFYERAGGRLAYTIVSGAPLPIPRGARRAVRDGTPLRSLRSEGRTVVTWLRRGRTCVLSGAGVSRATLVQLAAWKGEGVLAF